MRLGNRVEARRAMGRRGGGVRLGRPGTRNELEVKAGNGREAEFGKGEKVCSGKRKKEKKKRMNGRIIMLRYM